MNEHDLLKFLRKLYQLTQKELADLTGLNVSTISRYEKGHQLIPFSDLQTIFNHLNISFEEFVILQNVETETNYYFDLFHQNATKPNKNDIIKIYNYAKENKESSALHQLLYLKIKRIFSSVFPKEIQKISPKEIEYYTTKWLTQSYHSIYDYQILATISPLVPYTDFKKIMNLMVIRQLDSKLLKLRLTNNSDLRTQICVIFNNYLDVGIKYKEIKELSVILQHFRKFTHKYIINVYIPLIKYWSILIQSGLELTAQDFKELEHLAKGIEISGQLNMAEAMTKSIQRLKDGDFLHNSDDLVYT